jgi:protein-tyrosine-phosphatase
VHDASRPDLELRARRHAALSDPARLAIVDELSMSDRSPRELGTELSMESNLLAHHLDVLEQAGMVVRRRSSGDGRRRYVRLERSALAGLLPGRCLQVGPALFVCSANSARSQLAAALWADLVGVPAASAGTHPAPEVHPGAVAAARRAGLDLDGAVPSTLAEVPDGVTVITVCDRAHEELRPGDDWLHWSVPDPVVDGRAGAFDAAVDELRTRIAAAISPTAALS